jgi:hypothetical protein
MRRSKSALHTQEYFLERAKRSDRKETLRILEHAGKGNPPVLGDEMPNEEQPVQGKRIKKKTRSS